MGKFRKGTFVGIDVNLKNVCVGDTIGDEFGNEYTVNSYGMCVNNRIGGTKRFTEISKPRLIASYDASESEEKEEATDQQQNSVSAAPVAEETVRSEDERISIKLLTDQELAEELRARGYEVKATKTVVVEL